MYVIEGMLMKLLTISRRPSTINNSISSSIAAGGGGLHTIIDIKRLATNQTGSHNSNFITTDIQSSSLLLSRRPINNQYCPQSAVQLSSTFFSRQRKGVQFCWNHVRHNLSHLQSVFGILFALLCTPLLHNPRHWLQPTNRKADIQGWTTKIQQQLTLGRKTPTTWASMRCVPLQWCQFNVR